MKDAGGGVTRGRAPFSLRGSLGDRGTRGRGSAFLEAHPATGPLDRAVAQATLEDALQRIRTYAGLQVSGRAMSRGEPSRQERLIRRLRNVHMRPIVTIPRAPH